MIQDVPVEKECPLCLEVKLASEFYRDASRRDGLKFCCIGCSADYKPKKSRLNYEGYTKLCGVCSRELEAKFYMHSHGADQDNLEKKCRTCRSWKQRKTPPSVEEVMAYETQLDNSICDAVELLTKRYDQSVEEVLEQHRSELEQIIQVSLERQGLAEQWKLPLWIHATSDPAFDGNEE